MNDRLEKLKEIMPSWQEDADGNPVLDPMELSKTMQDWAKEHFGLDLPATTAEEAKAMLRLFAKQRGLKQPIFVEMDGSTSE